MTIYAFACTASRGFAVGAFYLLALSSNAQTGASCTETDTVSTRVQFAGFDRATQVLGHQDAWAKQLSDFELGARQRTAEPTTLHDFLRFAERAALSWTVQEEAAWQPIIERLGSAMAGLNLQIPKIDLVKTDGSEEFGAAYTRDRAIMLPASRGSLPTADARAAYFLLAHEVFHVLSRTDSRLRDNLYALLGFAPVKNFEYPSELEARRISNPDAFEYLHTLAVQAGSESVDVLPVIQSRFALSEVIQLPNFFAALDIVLLPVDTSTGEVRRDSDGNLIKYDFTNTNWVQLMRRNSSYIIHPEELLADNFATVMEWRSSGVLPVANPSGFPLNDVDLVTAIRDVLVSGCK